MILMLGIYKLPSSLNITPSCFGKKIRVKIDTLIGTMVLPVIEWPEEEPRIIAPPIDHDTERYVKHYTEDANEGWEKWNYWGEVNRYNSKKRALIQASLNAVIFEFKVDPANITYSRYLHGRGHPQGNGIQKLFADIDKWFESLSTWIEVSLDQDTNPTNPIRTIKIKGYGLQVLTIDEGVVSLPASANNIAVMLKSWQPVTLGLLRKIIGHVNNGLIPSDAHLLLKDGRAELRRNHYRKAVIDAGSAVEITLADFNDRVTHINTGPRPTLGWYVNQPTINSQANLPSNTKDDLVEIRNKAIHHNRVPSYNETQLALNLAKQIVGYIDPLPI